MEECSNWGIAYRGVRARNILILSSVGRSESSYVGNIVLKSTKGLYIYEPFRASKSKFISETLAGRLLKNCFRCFLPKDMFQHPTHSKYTVRLESNDLPRQYIFNGYSTSMIQVCADQDNVVIKTIRARLAWVKNLMDDDKLKVKLIHVVRDPRAVLAKFPDYLLTALSVKITCRQLLEVREAKKSFDLMPKVSILH